MADQSTDLEFLVTLRDQATAALQSLQGVLTDVTGPLPDITSSIAIDAAGAAAGVEEAASSADELTPAFDAAGAAAGAALTEEVTEATGDLPDHLEGVGEEAGSGLAEAAEAGVAGLALGDVVEEATAGLPAVFDEQGSDAGEQFSDGVEDEVTDGSAKWSIAAVAGITAAVAGVVGAAKGLFDVGAVFDDVSDTIAISTGKSGTALDGLTDIVDDIARTTPASFEDISSAVATLAQRTGLTGAPLEKLATQFVQLGNLGQQVDVNTVTGALAAFNVPAGQASSTLDTLFDISQATGVGVNELAGSVAQGAAAFKPFGLSITDSAALLGNLDKAGINSGATTAALTRGLSAFAAAGKDPRQALEDVITQIKGFTDAGNTAKAIDVAGGIFGTRGAAQFVNAVSTGKVDLDNLLASTGASKEGIVELAQATADAPESFAVLKNQALLALKPLGDEVWNVAGALGAAAVGQLPTFVSALEAGGRDARAFGADLAAAGTFIDDNRGKIEVIAGVVAALLLPALLAAGVNATISAAVQVGAWATSAAASVASSATSLAGLYAQAAGWVTSGASAVAGAAVQVGAWISAGAGAVAAAATYAVTFAAMLAGWIAQGAGAVAAAAVVVGGWIAMGAAAAAEAVVMAAAWLVSIGPIVLVIAAVVALVALIVTHWSQVRAATEEAWSAVSGFVSAAWSAIVGFVEAGVAQAKALLSAGLALIRALWQAEVDGWKTILTAVWGFITGQVSASIAAFRGAIEAGLALVTAAWHLYVEGWTIIVSAVWAAIEAVVSAGVAAVLAYVHGVEVVASIIGDAFGSAKTFVTAHVADIITEAKTLPGRITAGLADIASKVQSVGRDIIEGIKDGVTAAAAGLASTVANAAKGALDAAKSALGIHSPSRVFRDEVGAQMIAGWAEGLDGSDVVAAAEAIARDAAAAAAAAPSVDAGALASAAATSATPVQVVAAESTVTIRHEVTSPDGSLDGLTAAEVADLIARDPQAASALDKTLTGQRAARTALTFTAR